MKIPKLLIFFLLLIGATSIHAKSIKDVGNERPENEEEVKERRDLHKPGQMDEGYGRDADEKQQDMEGKDTDLDAIKGTDGDLNLKGYPIR